MSVTVTNSAGVTVVTLSASGDTATPQAIINAGFGSSIGSGRRAMTSASSILLKIAEGAVFDETGWALSFSAGAVIQVDVGYGSGVWRKGLYLGEQMASGGAYSSTQYGSIDGGTSLLAGVQTVGIAPKIEWRNVLLDSGTFTNRQVSISAPSDSAPANVAETAVFDIDGLTFDNSGQSGANVMVAFNNGTIKNLNVLKANLGLGGSGSIQGLTHTGLTDNAEVRIFPLIAGYVLSGYKPSRYVEFWFGLHVMPAGSAWYLDDPVFTSGFDWATKMKAYGGPGSINVRRSIKLLIKDAQGTNLSGATVRISSGATELYKGLQASATVERKSNIVVGSWTNSTASYRLAASVTTYFSQIVKVRKYGYEYVEFPANSQEAGVDQPVYVKSIAYLVSASAADALTGITLNFSTRTITHSGTHSTAALMSYYMRRLESDHADQPVEFSSADGVLLNTGAWNVVNNGAITGSIVTTGLVSGSGTVSGSVEDSTGVRVTVTKSGGGNFNISARKGTTGAYTALGYSAGVSTVTYTVPKGTPIEIVAWSLGHVTYTRLVDTSAGGVVLAMEMTPNPAINTALDVSVYLANITTTIDNSGAYPVFIVTANAPMTVPDIEVMKALVHRLVSSEVALSASFSPGSVSVLAINTDEITINKPAIRIEVGAGVSTTQRVYMDAYFNRAPALALNPAWELAPVRADGNQVQMLRTKPSLDPGYLAAKVVAALPSAPTPPTPEQNAAAVRTELTTELGRIDVATSTRLAVAGYTAPANADIAAIRAKTDVLVNADLSAVAKKTDLPAAPDNASIAAIKAKTDTLTNADLSSLATHADAAAISLQMGTPAQANALAALATTNQAEHDATQAAIVALPAPATPPTPAQNAAAVRTELTTELARIDAAISTRSTLQVADIPAGLTAAQVWAHATRTLTETPGLTAGQAEQLRKVAQLHGVGAQLVVTETTRTAGDVQQTITTDADGNTTVSAA